VHTVRIASRSLTSLIVCFPSLLSFVPPQLEKFTDELHGLTEQSMEELMKPEMRVRMLSFCQTVAKFRGHLIEGERKVHA